MPHAAHEAPSFSCCSVPECSSQCTAASQPLRCMQCPVLLQRLHAAEAEAHSASLPLLLRLRVSAWCCR